MRRRGLGGLVLLCALARAGDLQVAESAVKKAAALARPAVVTVITPDANDLDLTGVVCADQTLTTVSDTPQTLTTASDVAQTLTPEGDDPLDLTPL